MKKIRFFLIILVISILAISVYGYFSGWHKTAQAAIMRFIYSVRTTNGLIGYWSFDGPTINWSTNAVTDLSGKGYNGTLTSMSQATTPVPGALSQGLDFDGANDYVLLPDITGSLNTTALTISAWIKPRSINDTDPIVVRRNGADGGFGFWLRNSSTFYAAVATDGGPQSGCWDWNQITSASALSLNEWAHVVMVWDGSNLIIYTNGTASAPKGCTGTMDLSITTTRIGYDNLGGGNWIDGPIDEVRIYNRALSGGEIDWLYKQGSKEFANKVKDVNRTGLIGYWNFDDYDSFTLTNDMSGNDNHGTMYTTCTTTPGDLHTVGKFDNGLNLDGTNDCIEVTDPGTNSVLDFGSTDPITISAWIKPDSVTDNHTIITKGRTDGGNDETNYSLRTNGTNLEFYWCTAATPGAGCTGLWVSYTTSTNPLSIGNWQHVAVTHTFGNDAAIKIYYNGVSQAGGWFNNGNNSGVLSDDPLRIGAISGHLDGTNPDELFDGAIDEVLVYKRALSAAEIGALYSYQGLKRFYINAPQTNKFTNGLVGYWSFDGPDMLSGVVLDKSGNNSTGFFIGNISSSTKAVPGMVGQALYTPGGGTNGAGSGTYVKVTPGGTLANITSATEVMWIKPSIVSATDGVRLIGDPAAARAAGVIAIGRSSAGNIDVFCNSGWQQINNSITLSANQWYHLAYVVSAASCTLYINGEKQSTLTPGSTVDIYNGDFSIGGRFGETPPGSAYGSNYVGVIDEFRVYNRMLTDSEVYELYRSSKR